MSVRILATAGSAREGSFNKQLVWVAARGAEQAGAEVTRVDLRDYPMPLYDADLEAAEGPPKPAREWRALVQSHAGLLIASPENNGSLSALLKNAIDWATRSEDGQPDPSPFRDKVSTIMAASPGALGGLRGLVHLRAILEGLGGIVLPDQLTLRSAHEAFDDAGEFRDPKQAQRTEALGRKLAEFLTRLS